MAKQKRHSGIFKRQVVLAMRKEEKTVTQVAAQYGIHPGQLHRWKRKASNNFPPMFGALPAIIPQAQAYEEPLTARYAEIGQWTTQLEWLKKTSGLDPDPQ